MLNAMSRKVNGQSMMTPILEYSFHYSLARDGVYVSENNDFVAFFNHSKKNGNLTEKFYWLKMLLFSIKIRNIFAIYKHLQRIKAVKANDPNHFHFWFLGSNHCNELKPCFKFASELFELAKQKNAPIFAETTLTQNERVFSRFGFKTFQTIESKELNLRAFLMKVNVC
jgi:hypothetical protein